MIKSSTFFTRFRIKFQRSCKLNKRKQFSTTSGKKLHAQNGFRLQPTFWLFEVKNLPVPEEVARTTEQGSSMMYVAGDRSNKLKRELLTICIQVERTNCKKNKILEEELPWGCWISKLKWTKHLESWSELIVETVLSAKLGWIIYRDHSQLELLWLPGYPHI